MKLVKIFTAPSSPSKTTNHPDKMQMNNRRLGIGETLVSSGFSFSERFSKKKSLL